MSDHIIRRSKELQERWARERNLGSKLHPCSIRLDNTMNNNNATIRSSSSQRSRQDDQFFKMPSVPTIRNHTQTNLLRSNSQISQSLTTQLSQDPNNSTISHSNMKYLLENMRKTFLKCLDAHMLDFQNNTIQNDEQALLVYTDLNRIVCDGMASRGSEKNNGAHLGKMFVEFSKVLSKHSNTCGTGTTTTNSQHTGTDLGCDSDPTDFELAAFHSTQIGSNFDEPIQKPEKNVVNNPPSSISTATNNSIFQKLFQNKFANRDRGAGSTTYANELKNYTSIPTEQLLGHASASDNARCFSPDLSQSRIVRSKSAKNASKINAARIKDTLSRKLDSTISLSSEVITPITNWYIRRYGGGKIELFGCDSKSLSNIPVSHGVVRSKSKIGDRVVRTNKGLFKLIGTMKEKKELPAKVRQQFKNDFPRSWKKTLNDSGLFN
ncbi:hypothetical protein LSTR_LSTR003654 [Laodelphax striatellus]|uniref:Uncharacterized protein n=1 Tax=Laodelphax striatellus TaxID=195883 RepID=A0A482XBD9_LAOST|nr:hypothetical protein LSTR_LSTR003654 [Laodelphax striatellus]